MSGYTDNFYKPYSEYLLEPEVRAKHDVAINILADDSAFNYVVDLGCGLREFKNYHHPNPTRYMGVDERSPEAELRIDYRNLDALVKQLSLKNFKPLTAVSLFSTELSADELENWVFYNELFRLIPSIKTILVSGCYYRNRWRHKYAPEVCGTRSHQTVSPLGFWEKESDIIYESARLIIPCKSKMFGPDEIEVWRLINKKR